MILNVMQQKQTFAALNDVILARLGAVESEIREQRLPQAAAMLNALHQEQPKDPRIHLVAMQLAQAANNPKAALESAQRAVSIAPQWVPALVAAAMVASAQQQHVPAVDYAKRATALAPTDLGVVERAVSVANAASDTHFAYSLLSDALKQWPDDSTIQRALAYNLITQARYDEALQLLEPLVQREGTDELALAGKAYVMLQLARKEEAQLIYDRLSAEYPEREEYRYYLSIARDETPAHQPEFISRILFDSYAPRFDQHLVGTLGYRVPSIVAALIREQFPTLDCDVLDLGCGTGLLGVYLGKPKGFLVGVDLSTEMIKGAMKHGLYDRFHSVNLNDALHATDADEYDVIAACDVFIYVGDIAAAIHDAARVLRPGGLLVFSCERADEAGPDLAMQGSRRYAHKESATLALCKAAGLIQCTARTAVLRKEDRKDVAGFIVTARRAPSSPA